MLTLISGLPGSGKSYLSVSMLLKFAEHNKKLESEGKRPRPLYSDINGLKLDCVERIEGQLYDLPDGSIIFIDEAQDHRVFAAGWNYAKHKENLDRDTEAVYNSENDRYLNKHRHKGHDIYLITQGAPLLSSNIRDLAKKHIHCENPNNMDYCKYYVFPRVVPRANQMAPEKLSQAANGDVKRINFKPEIHALYKSTALDTKERDVPWGKIIKFLLIALAIIGLLIFAFRRSMNTTLVKSMSGEETTLSQGLAKAESIGKVETLPEHPAQPDLPHPSSIYGYQPDLTTYNHEYAFAGCVWMGDKRHCIAHDGSTLNISDKDFERFRAGDRPQRSQRTFHDQNRQAVAQVFEDATPSQNSIEYPAPPSFESI